jgi:hypothetical protein
MNVQLLSAAGDHLLADNAMHPIAPRPARHVVPPSGQKPASLYRLAERAERGKRGSIQLLFLGLI